MKTYEYLQFPCPACGYYAFQEQPGSEAFCPLCGWQDDVSQLRFPLTRGANKVSLMEAQTNYQRFGFSDPRLTRLKKTYNELAVQDPGWRPIEQLLDNIEESIPGVVYGTTYPADRTVLYYWRDNYWRKDRGRAGNSLS